MKLFLRHVRAGACLVAGITGLTGCGRSLFQRPKPALENIAGDIPGDRFKVIATVAGSDQRTDLWMSNDVRTLLNKEGFTAVPRAGRWETVVDAVNEICRTRGQVDGVLVITYKSLTLHDCVSNKTAYEIVHAPEAGGPGIQGLTRKLISYLRGEAKPS